MRNSRYTGYIVPSTLTEPASTAGGSTDSGAVPQILCTIGPMISARPKVTSATSMCERFCSGRSTASSKATPSAGQDQRHDDQRGPEAELLADAVAEVGPQHVQRAVTEVHHVAKAEDQGQAAGQDGQQRWPARERWPAVRR
jgi:hypothetical protein